METLEATTRRRVIVRLKPFEGKAKDLIEKFCERFGEHRDMESFLSNNLPADETLDTPIDLETITPFDLGLRNRIVAPDFFRMASSRFDLKKCHVSVPLRLIMEIDNLRAKTPTRMELHPVLVMVNGLNIGVQVTLPHPGDVTTLRVKFPQSSHWPIEIHEPCLFQVN